MRAVPVAALLAALCLPAVATADEENKNHLALSPELIMPFGDWADATGPGLGLNVIYYYEAGLLAYTGRIGYQMHLTTGEDVPGGEADLHTTEIPVLAGARFALPFALYGHLEAGLVHMTYATELNDKTSTSDGFRFGGAFGVGYHLESLDVGARLYAPDILGRDEGVDLSTAVTLNLVWTFLGI
jgi:hypothetical protein